MSEKLPPLEPHELGNVGEALFVGMCANAPMVCSKATQDTVGWDYSVSIPVENKSGRSAPLDSRKVAASCYVQVKTIWDRNDDVSLRLTSAEYLAKEPKPAFICVFRIGDARQCTSCYLIHVLGKPLGAILKRLRVEESQGTAAPNQKYISMAISNGEQIDPTGIALRGALSRAIGPDLHKYIVEKERQLNDLGFEAGAYKVELKLHPNSPEELIDTFLGMGDGIRATRLKITETRFSIPLLRDELEETIFNVLPTPSACMITVRSNEFTVPAVFKGEMFTPPIHNLPPEMRKARIVSDLFDLALFLGEEVIEYEFQTKVGKASRTLPLWVAYWKLYLAFAVGKGSFEISKGNSQNATPILFERPPNREGQKYGRLMLEASEAGESVARLAGLNDEPAVTVEELELLAPRAIIANAIAANRDVPVTLNGNVPDEVTDLSNQFMGYINYVWFGSIAVGYCAKVSFEVQVSSESRKIVSKDWKMLEVRPIRKFPEEWASFVDAAQTNAGLESFRIEGPPSEKVEQG